MYDPDKPKNLVGLLGDDAHIYFYRFPTISDAESISLEKCAESIYQEVFVHMSSPTFEERAIGPLPLHFLAYSTGGIALKLAMSKANANDVTRQSFVDSFHSIAFFGVPRE